MTDDPDSPDAVDLTQEDGHWTDERDDTEPPKELEDMTPDEIRDRYPKRAEEIIEELADEEGTKVAELRDE